MPSHIGQVIMSTTLDTAAKVKAIYGGTWVAWGAGRVPVGVDTSDSDFNAPNKTGGVKEVTLINGQMPKHFLTVPHIGYCENAYSISGGSYTRSTPTSEKQGLWQEDSGSFMSHKFSFGNNEAHSNLQPYSTIYMWRRTA